MSKDTDTPRTDTVERGFTVDSSQNPQYRLTEFARTLERELTEALEVKDMLAETLKQARAKYGIGERNVMKDLERELAEARKCEARYKETLSDLWHHYSLTGAAYELIEKALTPTKP